MATPELTPQEHELRNRLLAEAEQNGNAVVQVAGDDRGAPYAFSVGAWRRFGVAEAVVIGLPAEMSHVLINAYVARARTGERFEPGSLHWNILKDIPITTERVALGWYPEFLGSAFLLYSRGDFPAIQILVPNADGIWPWAPNAPDGFEAWQPVLTESGLPESWRPGVDGP